MKKCIKYLFSIIIIAIGTYFLANVSNVLGIGLTQHYTADRGPYTGELYFDSLVWSSACSVMSMVVHILIKQINK